MIEIITLGTGSAVPTRFRNLSATAMFRNGDIYLFDCGEGTQIQLRRAGLRPGRLKKIFISHFHGDHIFGLPGLLTSLQMAECSQQITLYGPEGLRSFVEFHKSFSGFTLNYPLEIVEVENSSSAGEFKEKGLTIKCLPLKHRMRNLGWAIIEDDRPGKFNAVRAKELNIPSGPLFSKLQNGDDIILDDGTKIFSKEVVGPKRKGHHVAYCLDTAPCDASIELARNADILIHDATFFSKNDKMAAISGHSTVAEAAEIAARADVRKLILTHFSARTVPEDEEQMLAEAQLHFPNVEIARDLGRYSIDYIDE
ncbi:MAG: ribonuclease Z [Calditrichaeota bacterium]|nr:MAG: ribonuclease Z [Calditrichota bacterium]